MNRGAGRQDCFLDDECCLQFLGFVEELVVRYDFVVHGYALMPNHFHLMVQTPRGNLSNGLRYLLSRYAAWLSTNRGWDGPVFRGRFKSRLVEEDAYWMHLLAYLHLNPVRARLVNRVDEASWTSHKAYVGQDPAPDWLTTSELIAFFRGIGGYEQYVADVRKGAEEGPDVFDADRLFVRQRREMLEREAEGAIGAGVVTFTPEKALAAVRLVTGKRVSELMRATRGRDGSPERWLAMWWVYRAAGLTQREIGEMFGVGKAYVSRTIRRVRGELNQDTRLGELARRLLGLLD